MGEVIDMLQMRMEEAQIGWACSAQNPDLLPESIRKKRGTKKQNNRRQNGDSSSGAGIY